MASHETCELTLSKGLQNYRFANWKLTRNFVAEKHEVAVPGLVLTVPAVSDEDYLHTRARVLRNHIMHSQGRCFIVTSCSSTPSSSVTVYEVQVGSPGIKFEPVASFDAGLGSGAVATKLNEPAVSCSLAMVAGTATLETAQLMILSLGQGDVRAIWCGSTPEENLTSNIIYPLRAAPPLLGARALLLEAVYLNLQGQLRCVCWAIKARTATVSAHCEMFMVTLAVTQPASASSFSIAVLDVELLQVSRLPPHLVLTQPEDDVVVMASQPDTDLSVQPLTAAAASGPAASAIGARPGVDDDEECDMDPRTIQEAAARLAKYTSDTPAGMQPPLQWADMYKETGPDNVGGMGDEPSCQIDMFARAPTTSAESAATPSSSSSSATAAAATVVSQRFQCCWSMMCGPHKVYAAEPCWGREGRVGLLGLSDDVDCVVLELACPQHSNRPQVCHSRTLPALAYLVAGKLARRHLLLAPLGQPTPAALPAPTAAVLVEAHQLYYTYRSTTKDQEYGEQDVVDMGLADDDEVLGARFLPTLPGPFVVILTGTRLLVHRMVS